MEQKKIFVYGSLREGFFNYEKYLKGKVIDKKLCRTKGKLYHLQNKGWEKAYVYVYNIEKDKLDKDSIYIPHGDWRKYMND